MQVPSLRALRRHQAKRVLFPLGGNASGEMERSLAAEPKSHAKGEIMISMMRGEGDGQDGKVERGTEVHSGVQPGQFH